MKKTLLFLGLASVMSVFTGCTKDEATNLPADGGKETNAPAILVGEAPPTPSTRTQMGPDGVSSIWGSGDMIAVYSKDATGNKLNYRLKEGVGTAVGTFERVLTSEGNMLALPYGLSAAGEVETRYVVMYPSQQFFAEVNGGDVSYEIGGTIPDVQNYAKGTYDKLAMPMLSVFSGEPNSGLKFKQLGALLHLNLTSSSDLNIWQIVLSGEGADIAGPVACLFEEDMSTTVFSSALERDAFFTDFSATMDYNKLRMYGESLPSITMNTTSGIQLGTTANDVYFGIKPGSYNGFKFMFILDDESRIVKSAVKRDEAGDPMSWNDVNPGTMINFPTFDLSVPYIPEITFAAATGIVSWTQSELVKNYSIVVMMDNEDGEYSEVTTIPVDGSDVSLATNILPALEEYIGQHGLNPGEKVYPVLFVKADYADMSIAESVYSIPQMIEWDIPTPTLQASIFVNRSKSELVRVNNYAFFTTLEYAILEGGNLAEEAFATASFTDMTGSEYSEVLSLKKGVQWTVMVKGTFDGEVQSIIFGYATEMPNAAISGLGFDNWMSQLYMENYTELESAYGPLTAKIYYTLGASIDVLISDAATFDYDGFYLADYFVANTALWGQTISIKLVISGDNLPNGSLTGIVTDCEIRNDFE